MIYRTLGKTGEKVSAIGLGGYHIGVPKDPNEGIRIIRTAVDRGMNFLDNCWDYHDGESERRMGRALRDGYRQKAFLMTKFDGRTRKSTAQQIDESLQRLETDHVELVQYHENIRMEDPDRFFAQDGPLEALLEAKKAGLLPELVKKAGELGLLSGGIPEQYGGAGLDKVATTVLTEKLSIYGGFAVTHGAHAGIGTLPIVYFGTEEQKKKYLPKLATGECIGAYCLSEPQAGSDAQNSLTRAELTPDGTHYILNGQKMWMSAPCLNTTYCRSDMAKTASGKASSSERRESRPMAAVRGPARRVPSDSSTSPF